MGKFIRICKTKKDFRLTIPKKFHFLFKDEDFVYVEEVNGILCIIPVAAPTLEIIEKFLKGRMKNFEVGKNIKG